MSVCPRGYISGTTRALVNNFFLHVAYARGSVRVPTNLENLELSGNFVNLEKSGNLRCGQGIFYDMSHGSRLA